MKLPSRLRRTVGVLASLTLVTGAIAIASPAARANGVLTGPSTATVSQLVAFTSTSPSAGNMALLDPSTGAQYGSRQNIGLGDPSATFAFTTPSSAQTLSLCVVDTSTNVCDTNTVTLTVSSVATTTAISAPNTAIIGTPITITSTVTSAGGSSYNPRGQIRISDANNATITTMGLTDGPGAGQSYAYFRWTPQTAGTAYFIATFVPAAGTLATGSSSNQDSVITTPSGNTISISAPPTFSLGSPVKLTATVYPSNTAGSVGFTVNGAAISDSIPISNGSASFTWTPNVAGKITLGASYTTNSGGSGSTSEVITVGAATASDVITLTQPGWGTWTNGGSYNMGNGANFAFVASTLSGAPVTLTETGPCQVSGLTLKVNSGSGACTLKATSAGGGGYTGVTYSYNVNLVPGIQTATIAAPPSGRIKVGRVLVLESPNVLDTDAGQNISWRIKKNTKKRCKLLYPDSGSVTLRIKSKGNCVVFGTAPGVSGQWQPFKTARKYRGR
jgi:hypothetical protein